MGCHLSDSKPLPDVPAHFGLGVWLGILKYSASLLCGMYPLIPLLAVFILKVLNETSAYWGKDHINAKSTEYM